MSRENIATVVKIIESLTDAQQQQLIEHLRKYIRDIKIKTPILKMNCSGINLFKKTKAS